MKKKIKPGGGVSKGAPSGWMISLALHGAAFFLAGLLIVFTVTQTEEVKFEPPQPVERPKMKLKKPKVKVKKNVKPQSSSRIVAKVQPKTITEIALPEMSGLGDAFAGSDYSGGFDLLAVGNEITAFGSSQTFGSDLVGTFYDLKQSRRGSLIPYSPERAQQNIKEFVRKGFKPSEFSEFYRSPNKLYASSMMIPPILSSMGPLAYGEPEIPGCLFLIHYKGKIVYPEDITFRFWGGSGDILLVGIDGEVVLNGCWERDELLYWPMWTSVSPDHRRHRLGFQGAAVGDWITLKAGEPRKIDILIGEIPGGGFSAQLNVEVEGVEYPRNTAGSPILPAFKTAELSRDQLDAIYIDLVEGETCLTNGPIFCDYAVTTPRASTTPEPEPVVEPVRVAENIPRTWTLRDGKTFEAKFVIRMGENVVFEKPNGKTAKVPWEACSDADRTYIQLATPPQFDFSMSKITSNRPKLDPGPYIVWIPPNLIDYEFTAKIRQISAGAYPHKLVTKFYVFGEEVDGDNYLLLDRQESSFTPTRENARSHSFTGPKVLLYSYLDFYKDRRGGKYGGYLITVTDERGIMIAHGTSHKWMLDIIGELNALPVGCHFNKAGDRVIPPRPKLQYSPYF